MTTTHGAHPSAPLLTATEARLIETGIASGRRCIAQALAGGEAATLERETLAAIAAHRQETSEMRWADFDREHIQPLEGRVTARLVPVRVPVRTFGRAAIRSPYARPRRMRSFVESLAWLTVVVGGAGVLLLGTAVLRAAWAAWGGAR